MLDPQRSYYGVELANFRRLLYRGLVAFPITEDAEEGATPQPDLATDTGTPNEDATEWSFTIKDGVTTYYDVISKPEKDSDVMLAGWGADGPSAMTVIPALFDSRPNFSSTSCGQDIGCYQSEDFESIVDQAASSTDIDEQNGYLQAADAQLGEDVAYIPLFVNKNDYLRGSKVTGYVVTPSTSMYPDLGAIGVER